MNRWLLIVGAVAIFAVTAVLYGVPFLRSASTPLLVGDGDSLMANGAALQRLNDDLGGGYQVLNVAVVGNRVGQEVLDTDMVSKTPFKLPSTRQIVWLIGGTNDLGPSSGGQRSVDRLLADVVTYFSRLHSRGFSEGDCLYTNLLPRSGTRNSTFEDDRRMFNSFVEQRLRGLARVVPSGSDEELQDPLDPVWYVDGTHLTSRGSQLLADDAFRVLKSTSQ